jgi:hypothetical protein
MATPITALSKGGHVYTIINYRGDKLPGVRWKFIGFKDGQRWGAFTSKKEWAKAVDMEPDDVPCPQVTPQYIATLHAEMLSTQEGGRILKSLQDAAKRQRMAHHEILANMDGQGTSSSGGTAIAGNVDGPDRP